MSEENTLPSVADAIARYDRTKITTQILTALIAADEDSSSWCNDFWDDQLERSIWVADRLATELESCPVGEARNPDQIAVEADTRREARADATAVVGAGAARQLDAELDKMTSMINAVPPGTGVSGTISKQWWETKKTELLNQIHMIDEATRNV